MAVALPSRYHENKGLFARTAARFDFVPRSPRISASLLKDSNLRIVGISTRYAMGSSPGWRGSRVISFDGAYSRTQLRLVDTDASGGTNHPNVVSRGRRSLRAVEFNKWRPIGRHRHNAPARPRLDAERILSEGGVVPARLWLRVKSRKTGHSDFGVDGSRLFALSAAGRLLASGAGG